MPRSLPPPRPSEGDALSVAPSRSRLIGIAGVAGLHMLVYFIVTRLTLQRPTTTFIEPHLPVDDLIPHLPWAWPLYWLPFLLVPLGAYAMFLRMDLRSFQRVLLAWSGMIVLGGLVQVIFPAVAPWPADPGVAQLAFHESWLVLPFATLPSMHVAHTAFAALVAWTTTRRSLIAVLGGIGTLLTATSTLVLKEHLLLDSLSGLALALTIWWWWRPIQRPR